MFHTEAFAAFTRHHVLVDSRDRDFDVHPTPSTYKIRLPRVYRNVVAARVLSLDAPLSFFAFSAARGTTTLKVRVGDATEVVTIADGTYDVESLCAELRAALEAAFPAKTFSVDVGARTMQLTLGCTQGDAVAVDTTEDGDEGPTDWGLAYYLGFPRGVVTAGTPVLRGPGMVNVAPFTYVLLDIEELGRVDEGALHSGGGVGKGAFCKVPVAAADAASAAANLAANLAANPFRHVFRDRDTATEPVECTPPVPRLETLTISWRFHDGSSIDFRGIEHSFVVELIVRKPRPLPALVAPVASASVPRPSGRRPSAPRPSAPRPSASRPQLPQSSIAPQSLQSDTGTRTRRRTAMGVAGGLAVLAGVWYWLRAKAA